MKLDKYVKQTLLDITNGVSAAREESPLWIAPGNYEGVNQITPQMVSFDIAVTVNKEGGGEIQVWSLGNLKAEVSSEQINRISFDVPVYFQSRKLREK